MKDTLLFMALVGAPTALFFAVIYLRWRLRMRLLEIVRGCAEQGKPLEAAAIGALLARPFMTLPERDYRRGVLYLGVAGAILAVAFCAFVLTATLGGPEAPAVAAGIAAFAAPPGCIGGALLVLARR
ncbi:MAG TPA: hypothetical protein VFX89_10585, partial [Gammaproteobacteria bacterium]|nr:hypothetical protein [Gammaproteobacteria bacterium]